MYAVLCLYEHSCITLRQVCTAASMYILAAVQSTHNHSKHFILYCALLLLHTQSGNTTASLVTFAVMSTACISCAALGLLADRIGRCNSCLLCMMVSGSCAIAYGPLAAAGVSQPVMVVLALVWGAFTIAESAQFSAIVSETCDQSAVGTALTLQLAMGYIATVNQRLYIHITLCTVRSDHRIVYTLFVYNALLLTPRLGIASVCSRLHELVCSVSVKAVVMLLTK
jgi:MFS family permease